MIDAKLIDEARSRESATLKQAALETQKFRLR